MGYYIGARAAFDPRDIGRKTAELIEAAIIEHPAGDGEYSLLIARHIPHEASYSTIITLYIGNAATIERRLLAYAEMSRHALVLPWSSLRNQHQRHQSP
jgi:hypothetical protein